jgi:hypothetical protein
VFDFGPYAVQAVPDPPIWPQLLAVNKDGKRLIVSDYFLVEDLIPGGVRPR